MRALILAITLGGGDAGTHQHCWHMASMQHAVPCHGDWECCHCGKQECRRSELCSLGSPQGHGPYAQFGGLSFWLDGGTVINLTEPGSQGRIIWSTRDGGR